MYTKEFEPFGKKVWLASPTIHGEELKYVTEVYETNWRTKDNRDNRKRGVIADFY